MSDALDRARTDLADGRAWKARDRLTGLLAVRRDDDVVDLLAQVHYEMGDLPAAGALWLVTGHRDEVAASAMAAWRERAGNDEARWSSLPKPLRTPSLQPHVADLGTAATRSEKGRARAHRAAWKAQVATEDRYGIRDLGGCAAVLTALVLIVIGCFTVANWLLS